VGGACGLLATACTMLLTHFYSGAARSRALGFQTSLGSITGLAALLIGGFSVQAFTIALYAAGGQMADRVVDIDPADHRFRPVTGINSEPRHAGAYGLAEHFLHKTTRLFTSAR
jgi:hypothetical protein